MHVATVHQPEYFLGPKYRVDAEDDIAATIEPKPLDVVDIFTIEEAQEIIKNNNNVGTTDQNVKLQEEVAEIAADFMGIELEDISNEWQM